MKTKELGSLQEKIMNILWASEKPLKPAEVQTKLCGCQAYTTIMTVLSRMVKKKLLVRKFVGKVYYYSPTNSKDKFVESNLKGIYSDLVGSYGQVAISNFIDVVKNNKDDMALLKKYLESNK